jgi:site-specific DNA-methyltransferase (adenine-specific)/adenine-specific DNA-methyltransferase
MDELFGESNFVNEIAWCYTGPSSPGMKGYANKHDVIFLYSKNRNFTWNVDDVRLPYADSTKKNEGKKTGFTSGNPDLVVELNPLGKYPEDWWRMHVLPPASDERKYIKYPTQKPELLLEKVIKGTSNPDDLVLDAFAGSGTTLAVAEKLKRKWIGVDCGKLSIYTIQKRLLNLRQEIGQKGSPLKAKTFTLYNAGLYDWAEVKKLDFRHYRDFVLKLFQVREEKHDVRGIEVDGYIGNENAYLWNHTKEKKAKLDLDFIKSLHNALSGKGGEVFYIIAPTNAFAFYEDEIKYDDTIYKTLRVPQSVITELIKRGGDTIKQPTSEQDVNDTIDAVGFDFIRVPQVETEYKIAKPKVATLLNQKTKECVIKIKTFKSQTLTKSPEEFENYETLSMVMVDYNYDGKVFDLDEVFYADTIKPDFEVRFDGEKLDKQMMVIYLDIYGNEKKEILNLKDFKK